MEAIYLKLKLAIADSDYKYIDSFTNFISSNYSKKFNLTSFTRADIFTEYLKNSYENIDILLLTREFLSESENLLENINIKVLLSDGVASSDDQNYHIIHKYQAVDNIIAQIMEVFTEKKSIKNISLDGKKTKLVSVYSPIGGVGKTSVSLALAAKLAEYGTSVMLISLEGLGSFFAPLLGTGTCALTNVMLGVLDNSESIIYKTESNKTFDNRYGFYYLEPPECFRDITDVNSKELNTLFTKFKNSGKYDYIVVDMESKADNSIFSVFNHSDSIIFVTSPEPLSYYKTQSFIKQFKKIDLADQSDLVEKFFPVVNKYADGFVNTISGCFDTKWYTIPFLSNLWTLDGERYIFDSSKSMRNTLTSLAEDLGGAKTNECYE